MKFFLWDLPITYWISFLCTCDVQILKHVKQLINNYRCRFREKTSHYFKRVLKREYLRESFKKSLLHHFLLICNLSKFYLTPGQLLHLFSSAPSLKPFIHRDVLFICPWGFAFINNLDCFSKENSVVDRIIMPPLRRWISNNQEMWLF